MNKFHQPTTLTLQGRNLKEAMANSINVETGYENKEHHGRQWSPYEVNGGTVSAISAEGKIIIGCDTR